MDRNTLLFSIFDSLLVAPRRGAWIEIRKAFGPAQLDQVAPRRGAWIEISNVVLRT